MNPASHTRSQCRAIPETPAANYPVPVAFVRPAHIPACDRRAARAAQLRGCALLLALLPMLAAADPLPASVRACAAEPDVTKRLACFDREVARFPATTASQTAPAGSAAAGAGAAVASGTAGVSGTAGAAAAVTTATPATASNPTAEKSQDAFGFSPEHNQPKKPSRITAHVVSVGYAGKAMVVHLDNGQVWTEVPQGMLTTKLKIDDTVTIDKGVMGAYWLRGPAAGLIKVERKQ